MSFPAYARTGASVSTPRRGTSQRARAALALLTVMSDTTDRSSAAPQRPSHARILVVGESAAPGSTLRHILLTEGYSGIQCVPSAREALGLLAKTTPDLVIVDVAEHDAQGFDLLNTISGRAQEQILPVLIASDSAGLVTRLQALEAGAQEIIGKPLERSEVAFRVRNLLHMRRLFEELRQSKLAVERQFLERTTKLNDALDLLKKAEKELARRQAESEAESRGKSEFVADIGHELRTPLNAILGFSEAIRDQWFGAVGNPKYVQYAVDMHEAGTHLLRIVEDLLELSKAEAGKLNIRLEEVAARDVVASSLRMLSGLADQAGVDLNVDFPANFPVLHTDSLRFSQALINIVTNAVKFTPAGGSVTVRGRREPDSGAAVLIISDTGIGIAKRDIPTALSPYGQVRSAQRKNTKGTGLGLPLTKRIVEALGATFELDSTPGEGTVVTFRFPPDLVG